MSSPEATAALERLLAELGGRLRALVRQRVPRALGVDPDEVEQGVRLRLWGVLQREKTILHPTSYLYRTVMSVIVDHVRKRRSLPIDTLPDELLALSSEQAVERIAKTAELARLIHAAMKSLPERRRRPVQLHLQGIELAQIAVLLQESESTVRNLVYRGLSDLRLALRERGVEHDE